MNSFHAYCQRLCIILFISIFLCLLILVHDLQVYYDLATEPAFCNLSSQFNCDAVSKSKWAWLWPGMPLVVLPLAWFCFQMFVLLRAMSSVSKASLSRWQKLLGGLCYLSVTPVICMALVAFFLLGKFCLYCVGIYISTLLSAGLWYAWHREIEGVGIFSSFKESILEVRGFFSSRNKQKEFLLGWEGLYSVVLSAVCSFSLPGAYIWMIEISEHTKSSIGDLEAESRRKNLISTERALKVLKQWKSEKKHEISVNESELLYGTPHASVKIVEFSDFQCPACRKASNLLKELYFHYPRDVAIYFKDYPLDSKCNPAMRGSLHHFACDAAIIASCVGIHSSELFKDVHEALFSITEFNEERLMRVAKDFGLNESMLEECRSRNSTAYMRIQESIKLASHLGISRTPSIYLNGKMVNKWSGGGLLRIVEEIAEKGTP